jgi:hypothetical protein
MKAPQQLALALGFLTPPLLIAAAVLAMLSHDSFTDAFGTLIPLTAFAVMGSFVARRQPRNPVGWLLAGSGLLLMLYYVAERYALLRYSLGHDGLPLGSLAIFLGAAILTWPLILPPLAILLFPDGKLTQRWRWIVRAYVVLGVLSLATQIAVAAVTVIGNHLTIDSGGDATYTPAGPLAWLSRVDSAAGVPIVVMWLVFLSRQIVLYRSSTGDARQQLKALVMGAGVFTVSLMLLAGLGGNSTIVKTLETAAAVGLTALPIGIAVGILKYRLYEIDRLVSRTLVYGSLTVFLAATYVGLVLSGQAVFSSVAGGSNLAVAVSTLVVAALFLPVRAKVQQFVDRRFYRRRYDAQQTLQGFGARLREEVDLETLGAELRIIVGKTMQPAHVGLWLRKDVGGR